jgi:uncharacterized damage-inducible protein DinB
MGTSLFTIEGAREFHRWTHASLTLLLDHLSTIPSDEYVREVANFGVPTLRQQVIHIFNCEGVWIHALQGIPYLDRTPADCLTIGDAKLLQREMKGQTFAYLARLTDQEFNTATELRFPDGDRLVRVPAFILHHILTHAFHHKGQIVAMCRALGHPAPDTDMSQIQ